MNTITTIIIAIYYNRLCRLMKLLDKKSIHKIITFLSSTSLILLIFLTGTPPQTSAVYLSPGQIENDEVLSGTTALFKNVTLTIRSNERIPISYLEFTVFNSLNNQKIGYTRFDVSGAKIMDSPSGSFIIERTSPLASSWYSFGYNFGYDEFTGYGYDFGYGYGYGYGDPSQDDITFTYDITFTSSVPGTFYATFTANCTTNEFSSDASSDFYVISQYPPIPQKERIYPKTLSAVTDTMNFTYDFIDLEDDLDHLTIQISGPAPYDSEGNEIQWTFAANQDNPWEDWTNDEILLAEDMGVNITFNNVEEKWILTIDTTKTWMSQNPWNQSMNSSVWPSGGYNFSIEVGDRKGNTWGSIDDNLQFSTFSYAFHTIQPVINLAESKDSVYVLNGTFTDQIQISKNIHLQGSESSIIQPDAIPQAGVYDVQLNAGSSGTIIENLIFDFNGVNNTRSGLGLSIGQASFLTRDITLKNNRFYPGNISGVGGTAIRTEINGDLSGLSIRYNTIIADDSCNGNGMVINPFYGPGTIELYNNHITGNISNGIIIQSSNVRVSCNDINNSFSMGLSGLQFIDPFGGMTFDNVQIVSNKLSHFNQGMIIGNPSSQGSFLEAEIASNTITENTIGILVRFDAVLQNSVHYNNILDNSIFGLNNIGSSLVNATYNWWGDPSGPYHSSNPSGLGNPVSNNVLFSNWLPLFWNNTIWVDDNYDNNTPGWGIDHFNTTTDGINAAFDGGFVNLNPGVYDELLSIDKPLTLQAKYLFPDSTIITDETATYGEFDPVNGQTIQIASSDVTINGLNINRVNDVSFRSVAAIGNSNHPNLYDISILNCSVYSIYDGIYLNEIENVILNDNINITSNKSGVLLRKCNNSIMKRNQFIKEDGTGFTLVDCVDVMFVNNSLSHKSTDAILIKRSNTVFINQCHFENNSNGLHIIDSLDVQIINSNFSENEHGISLFGFTIAILDNNSFFNNTWNLSHVAEVEHFKYYGSVQNAVLHAGLGKKINLYHGTYNENVIIDKKVVLNGYDQAEDVVIDGAETGPAILVGLHNDVRDVTVRGVSLHSNATCVKSERFSDVSGLTIKDCIIQNEGEGYAVSIDPHQFSDFPPIRNGTTPFTDAVRFENNYIRGGLLYQYSPFELFGVNINKQLILHGNDVDVIKLNGSIAVRLSDNHLWSITARNTYDLTIRNNEIVNDPGTMRNGINLWSIDQEPMINKVLIYNNSIIGFSDTESTLGISGAGIVLAGGIDVSIDSNNIYANSKGIYVTENFINQDNQLCKANISDLSILNNDIELGQTAILLLKNVSHVELRSNNLTNNGQGIWLRKSFANTITQNRISEHYYGLRIDSNSSHNLIYDNYFTDNQIQAQDLSSTNQWNVTLTAGENIIGGTFIGGNYWDTYEGIDTDGDYIGDTLLPFTDNENIKNGGDYHPLLLFDKFPPMVTVLYPNGGEVINTSETVIEWQASDNESEIDNVTIYYSSDHGENWTLLSENEENDGEYIWDLSDIAPGENYSIKVMVSDIAGNTMNDTSDDLFGIDEPTYPGIHVDLIEPIKGWVYFFNRPILRLFPQYTVLIGQVTIVAEIESAIELDRIEFYIDEQLMKTRSPNEYNLYEWTWDDRSLFSHEISVKAYDVFGRSESKSMNAIILNLDLIP